MEYNLQLLTSQSKRPFIQRIASHSWVRKRTRCMANVWRIFGYRVHRSSAVIILCNYNPFNRMLVLLQGPQTELWLGVYLATITVLMVLCHLHKAYNKNFRVIQKASKYRYQRHKLLLLYFTYARKTTTTFHQMARLPVCTLHLLYKK